MTRARQDKNAGDYRIPLNTIVFLLLIVLPFLGGGALALFGLYAMLFLHGPGTPGFFIFTNYEQSPLVTPCIVAGVILVALSISFALCLRRAPLRIRNYWKSDDVPTIVRMHRDLYAREQSFDSSFAQYVAAPLTEFSVRHDARERVWIAEAGGEIVGCIAIVAAEENKARLRRFLVAPQLRGHGLGTKLLRNAVTFARQSGYGEIILWTVSALTAAARLYRAAGFTLAEQRRDRCWGVDVVEEKYELNLCSPIV